MTLLTRLQAFNMKTRTIVKVVIVILHPFALYIIEHATRSVDGLSSDCHGRQSVWNNAFVIWGNVSGE